MVVLFRAEYESIYIYVEIKLNERKTRYVVNPKLINTIKAYNNNSGSTGSKLI
jgi:hypothetical protein